MIVIDSSKVNQPSIKKIPEVTVLTRERYYDKVVDEIKMHLKSCTSNQRCPTLNDRDVQQCAAQFEWNCFSTKGNIHMYRREIVNLTKSLREASRQVEVHPLIGNFLPNQSSVKNSKPGKLNTILDYISKNKNSENRLEDGSIISSHACSDSHKTGASSDNSQGREPKRKHRCVSLESAHCDDASEKHKTLITLDSGSEGSERCSPRKNKRLAESIEKEKPLMKYFFDSVSCTIEEPIGHPVSLAAVKSAVHFPNISLTKGLKFLPIEIDKKNVAVSPPKKRRRKSLDLFSDKTEGSEKSKKSEQNKTTTQIRNDNLKKAADLVRKHLNPEYKSKRISKDFFKIVCRSISHRLVESDAVNDTAAKFEVEKLLQSNGAQIPNQ